MDTVSEAFRHARALLATIRGEALGANHYGKEQLWNTRIYFL
jgi:hypothetical protein